MEYVATAAFLLSVVAGSFAAVIFGGYGIAQLIASALYELGCKQHLSSLMSRRMVTERRQHAPAVVCPSRRGRCEDHFFRSVAQPQECLSLPEREPLPLSGQAGVGGLRPGRCAVSNKRHDTRAIRGWLGHVDHQHGRLYGAGAKPFQGLLARLMRRATAAQSRNIFASVNVVIASWLA